MKTNLIIVGMILIGGGAGVWNYWKGIHARTEALERSFAQQRQVDQDRRDENARSEAAKVELELTQVKSQANASIAEAEEKHYESQRDLLQAQQLRAIRAGDMQRADVVGKELEDLKTHREQDLKMRKLQQEVDELKKKNQS